SETGMNSLSLTILLLLLVLIQALHLSLLILPLNLVLELLKSGLTMLLLVMMNVNVWLVLLVISSLNKFRLHLFRLTLLPLIPCNHSISDSRMLSRPYSSLSEIKPSHLNGLITLLLLQFPDLLLSTSLLQVLLIQSPTSPSSMKTLNVLT